MTTERKLRAMAAVTCPRCFGLLVPESDRHGAYCTCLNCGHQSYPEPVDYTLATNQGRRMEGRLIGRSKRGPYQWGAGKA